MKKNLLLLLLPLAYFSCKEITYKESQPQGRNKLTEVPRELRGKYITTSYGSPTPDTLVISAKGYAVGHDPKDRGTLNDSLVLKYYKGYYFLNIREHPEWILRVIKREKNGDVILMAMETDQKLFDAFVKKLNGEIEVDSSEVDGRMLYQIDPSPKEMIGLIRNGYFKSANVLKKLP